MTVDHKVLIILFNHITAHAVYFNTAVKKKVTAVKNFYIHFLLYFNKALLMVVAFQILKLRDVWLWSYSTAKYGEFK